jgi:hypothetical protein
MEVANWLHDAANGRRIGFLGDCDPPDLLTFAYLKSRLVEKLGINAQESMMIPLAESELDAAEVMDQVLPDLPSLIGPMCTEILRAPDTSLKWNR